MKSSTFFALVMGLFFVWRPTGAAAAPAVTEGKYVDPSCNCVRDRKDSPLPIDRELIQKIQAQGDQDREKSEREAGRKLLSQVKSYRCPRPRKSSKDDVDLSAYGIDEEIDSVEEILEGLITKARVDESLITADDRDRAVGALEKKVEKCAQSSRNRSAKNDQSSQAQVTQGMIQMQMMMMMAMQNSGSSMGYGNMMMGTGTGMNSMYGMNGMYGMNPMYGMYNTTGMSMFNPYALMNGTGYSPWSTATMSLGSLTPAQQVALRGSSVNASLLGTSNLSLMTPAQQVSLGSSTSPGMWTAPFPWLNSTRPWSSR